MLIPSVISNHVLEILNSNLNHKFLCVNHKLKSQFGFHYILLNSLLLHLHLEQNGLLLLHNLSLLKKDVFS